MINVAEIAYKRIRNLPVDLQLQVIDYIDSIGQQHRTENNNLEPLLEDKMTQKRKLGFMRGKGSVPEDINWGDAEIEAMFNDSK